MQMGARVNKNNEHSDKICLLDNIYAMPSKFQI